MTVYARLAEAAARYPDNDLLVYPGWLAEKWRLPQSSWTYREVLAMADRLAQRYRSAGYGRGHRVALALGNRPEHFFHWLALNSIGASKVPLNPDYKDDERAYVLEHSEAQGVVSDENIPRAKTPPVSGSPSEDDECALLYTSGTTGRPKGCMLSNGYFFGWGEWYAAQRGLISLQPGRERLMQVLPTFHINAVGNSFMGMLYTGGAQVMLDRFHSSTWWQDAVETRATCFHYLGVIPAMLLNLPPSPLDRAHRMRFGLGGGVHPAHHAAFEARFGVPLLEGWAMTETGGGGIVVASEEPRHVGEGCIGRPDRPGPPLEVRIAEDGEFLVRSRSGDPRRRFFSGYFKDAAATEKAWEGGWLHTGDIVRLEGGRLFFQERKKNIIRRSGENIAGMEVESMLLTHPAVGQAAVLAVRDEMRGEEVLAVVAPKPGYAPGAELAASIAEHCLERLAYFKAPGYVAFRAELPTTSTLKIRAADLGDVMGKDCFDLRSRKTRAR